MLLTANGTGAPLAANPVPVPVSVAGSVPEFGVNDHEGAAVNVEVAVGVWTPSFAKKDSAVFGAAVTVNEQVSVPWASVEQEPRVIATAVGIDGAIVTGWLATKPVPVAVSTAGRVAGPVGVNDQEAVAVNAAPEVTVFVPSEAVNVSGAWGEAVTVIVHEVPKLPVASDVQADCVNVTALGFVAANVIAWFGWKPVA